MACTRALDAFLADNYRVVLSLLADSYRVVLLCGCHRSWLRTWARTRTLACIRVRRVVSQIDDVLMLRTINE